MKANIVESKDIKKGKKYCSNRINIPKLLIGQCQWTKKTPLNIAMGFQSNGKPYLMITEVEHK